MKQKIKICPRCNEKQCKVCYTNYSKDNFTEYCLSCMIIVKHEKRKKSEYKVFNKICKCCNKEFTSEFHNSKFCKNPCKSMKSQAQKWIDKKPAIANGIRNDQIAYSFFRKKYGPGKQFQACRG